MKTADDIVSSALASIEGLDGLAIDDKVDAINRIREALHIRSPFKDQPVDFVRWVKNETVHANDYNPNSVAPPEMELLYVSIQSDGYTQPIVSMRDENGGIEVIDGFHRHRVGKERKDIERLIHGYLPVVQIREECTDKTDRMASTIRHNRARGKHKVDAMSDIVIELKRRNWSNEKIAMNLGMDQDEVLRLCQISGLAEIFSGQEFSRSWEPSGHFNPEDFEDISGDSRDYEAESIQVRTANTDDEDRVFHTYEKWECHKAGFYETKAPKGMSVDDCKQAYKALLSDIPEFSRILDCVVTEWKHSCEHYLTNKAMNRIAWLGQASLCYKHGIPSEFRGGYSLLTEEQQLAADNAALEALNNWMIANGRNPVSMEDANPSRQSDIY